MSYKDYRQGSPVLANGKVSVIEELPRYKGDPFGYKVSESADGVQEDNVKPIELTADILKHYGFYREGGTWVFEAGKRNVRVGDDWLCSIDGALVGEVKNLHELKNILIDNCGFVLRRYYDFSNHRPLAGVDLR